MHILEKEKKKHHDSVISSMTMARTVLLKNNVYAKSCRDLFKSIFHPIGLRLGKSVGISNLQKRRAPEIVKTWYM